MKKIIFFIILSIIFFDLHSQDFLGYSSSNYAGVTGTDLQPASVVDSRFKFDMTLVGLNFSAANNYVGMKYSALKRTNGKFTAFDDTNFATDYLVVRNNEKDKSLFFSNQIQLVNFMGTINSRSAFAIKVKMRNMINIDGVSNDLATLAYNQLDYQNLWKKTIANQNLSVQTMSWAEYGLGYGLVIKEKGKHFLKVGATVKLLQGLQAAYLYARDIKYQFNNDTVLSVFRSDISYGHSNNFDFSSDNIQYKFNAKPSVGFDFGVVYEWRPKYDDYVYEIDGKQGQIYKDKNKYKLKVGLSVLDIGSLEFKKGEYSRDFKADINDWNIRQINPLNIAELDDSIKKRFILSDSQVDQSFKMSLPTTVSAQIDFNIWKDFYINLTPYYSIWDKKRESKLHDITSISITPRWDHRWFGVFVPVSRDVFDNTRVGLGLRLGPLVIGTNNISPFISKKEIYAMDIYTLIKIPIMYKKIKDKDKDKVSDKLDKCKDIPGVWEFYGCPDRDGDHVEDKEDQCPDDAGLPEFKGCPDRDGDKIIDRLDACPDDAGIAKFNGCPDKDGDGIIDKEDECPDDAGIEKFKGCPDRDGDGLIDKSDKCPDKAGPISNNGCPEVKLILLDPTGKTLRTVIRGKDGSFSFDELPPDEQVSFRLVSEGENVEDITDIKVNVGVVSKKAIKETKDGLFRFIVLKTDFNKLDKEAVKDVAIKLNMQEAAIIRTAFNNLEFATGKDIIKQESYASLDQLADLMNKKIACRLKLSGHTDNQGNPATNLKLSQRRAEAVKKYLVKKGINESRFKVEGFGDKKPVSDNKTSEGRQKNRRVEMLLIE